MGYFKLQHVSLKITVRKEMTKEERKIVIEYLIEQEAIIKLMSNPKCDASMNKILQTKLIDNTGHKNSSEELGFVLCCYSCF